MEIVYLGHSCFKIKGKNATVVTDPYNPSEVGLKFPKITADIVTISHEHGDHNHLDLIDGVKRVIRGPGEYEVMGVSVVGFGTFHDDKKGEERGKNTIYVIEMDDIRIVHMGDIGHSLPQELVEEIGNVDILMLPVGGYYTIDSEKASEIVREIEPSIIIPMHYNQPGLNPEVFSKLTTADDFLKSVGLTVEKMDKLSLKKSDIPEEGQKVVVLERKA